MKWQQFTRLFAARLIHDARLIPAGGSWAVQLPSNIQRNLRWFFFDGFLAASSDGIYATYLSLFVLALGATPAQLGLMTSLGSLTATLALLPGAILVERIHRRKPIVLVSGGGIGRGVIFFIALVPLLFSGPAAVYTIIALKVLGDTGANLGFPAWTSLAADVVPLTWRGRYFATRNVVMSIAGMVVTFLAGQFITHSAKLQGYQIAMMAAFVISLFGIYCYSRLQDAPAPIISSTTPTSVPTYSLASIRQTFKEDPNFLRYCIFGIVWNIALSSAGPFFNPYLVQNLNSTPAFIGTLSVVASLASIPAMRWFGRLADRWGPNRVMQVTGLLIPLLPLAWVFTTQAWQGIPINILGGFLWAGFNLAAFNFLLSITPKGQIARYSAFFQIAVALSSSAGAAMGGLIVTLWGYKAVFAFSFIGRLIGAILFSRFVKSEPKSS